MEGNLRLFLDVALSFHLVCLRICGTIRSAWGWRCFRVTPFRRHSFGTLVSIRSARNRLTAISGLSHRNALPPCRRPVQHLHPLLRSSLDASPKACAATNKTGYPTNSAGGRGASATGPGIPARGGIAQTGAEAWRRACGRYSDPSHAAAYAHGCAILRRKRNHWRSGDAPKCRRRARATVGSTDPQRQTHRCEKKWSARRTTPKAIS